MTLRPEAPSSGGTHSFVILSVLLSRLFNYNFERIVSFRYFYWSYSIITFIVTLVIMFLITLLPYVITPSSGY